MNMVGGPHDPQDGPKSEIGKPGCMRWLAVSLLPATATVIGVVVLAQIPTALVVLGVALVIAGVALHRSARPLRSLDEREPNTPSPART